MISSSASWNPLSSLLTTLSSGAAIVNISQNFINWSGNANFAIAGHIIAANPTSNQFKMIDVTDYVNQMINSGASQLHFLLYRPFRHMLYSTPVGIIPADNLSLGSQIVCFPSTSDFDRKIIINHHVSESRWDLFFARHKGIGVFGVGKNMDFGE